MRWNSSTLDYFSKNDPNKISSFQKRRKIRNFLTEIIEVEDLLTPDGKVVDITKLPKLILNCNDPAQIVEVLQEAPQEVPVESKRPAMEPVALADKKKMVLRDLEFPKIWFQEDSLLMFFSFLKMLNEDIAKRDAFFSEFLSEYFTSDQVKAQQIAEEVYTCISDALSISLKMHGSDYAYLNQGVNNTKGSSREPFNYLVLFNGELRKTNPLQFGFEIEQVITSKVSGFLNEYKESAKPSANYRYASGTLKSLMRQSIRKNHPSVATKQILGYIVGGVCLALAVAALAYLTIQTAGLIHLTWIVPTAILAATGSVGAVAGTGAILGSTPSISNRICSLFSCNQKKESPKPQKLFEEQRPMGMLFPKGA